MILFFKYNPTCLQAFLPFAIVLTLAESLSIFYGSYLCYHTKCDCPCWGEFFMPRPMGFPWSGSHSNSYQRRPFFKEQGQLLQQRYRDTVAVGGNDGEPADLVTDMSRTHSPLYFRFFLIHYFFIFIYSFLLSCLGLFCFLISNFLT